MERVAPGKASQARGRRIVRSIAAITLLLVLIASTVPVHASAETSIEARINSAMEFVAGQYSNVSQVAGFLRGTGQTVDSHRLYSEDAGLVALSLAFYEETHYSTAFPTDQYLKDAVDFLLKAQTSTGDFYDYYDQDSHTWQNGGRLYTWDASVLMGVAYAAYVSTIQSSGVNTYWTSVVDNMLLCVNDFQVSQLPDGAIQFYFPNGAYSADLESNGAMLMALIYFAIFEHYVGDTYESTKLAVWSEGIAQWLLSQQESNDKSWGFGGFYHNSSQTLQLTYENSIAMLGLLSYYRGIGVLLTSFQPIINQVRESMISWGAGFFARIIDTWGGPRFGRGAFGNITYPKSTLAAASLAQAMGDIWIDIGSYQGGKPDYWTDATKPFQWMIGSNERNVDLQQQNSVQGTGQGFYEGIDANGIVEGANLATTALALYAMLKIDQIGAPEVFNPPVLTIALIAVPLFILHEARRKRGGSGYSNRQWIQRGFRALPMWRPLS